VPAEDDVEMPDVRASPTENEMGEAVTVGGYKKGPQKPLKLVREPSQCLDSRESIQSVGLQRIKSAVGRLPKVEHQGRAGSAHGQVRAG
jgi:hypothetical protein